MLRNFYLEEIIVHKIKLRDEFYILKCEIDEKILEQFFN